VGPDFQPPAEPDSAGYSAALLPAETVAAPVPDGQAQRFVPALEIPRQWWTLFHSTALNQLINTALQRSPSLQAAQAALRVAQENVAAQQGAYYPSVVASLSPSRQKAATSVVTSPLASGNSLFSLHTAQVTVSYTFDLFGNNRRQVEGLEAQSQSQRYQLEAAYVSLTTNLVVAAVQEASLRAQITATQALVRLQEQQLDLFRRQLAAGAIAEVGVVGQEAALAQNRALLPPLRKQLAQQRDALIALTGGFPNDTSIEAFDLSMLQLPRDLPVSLPSNLVEQRPDVKSAEEQLHAASAQIGLATANMLPQLTLDASGGSIATQIGQLFKSGSGFWSLTAALTQPLFDGGTLLHRRRAAQAAYDEAGAQYRTTVISAFQNVADVLQALQFDAELVREAADAEKAAASSLAIGQRQMELGDISYLALLAADQAYQQASIGLLQARASRYADTAALFQALGGGWWNAPAVAGAAWPGPSAVAVAPARD
jgi:NodT family efflux transporter outer membrane factor (OMF) lipoprotein